MKMNDTNDENIGDDVVAVDPATPTPGADPFTPVDDSHANTRYVMIAIAVLIIIAIIVL